MAEAMIEVNKLSKLYLSGALFKKSKPAVRALDDVSIRLEKGKILGIVGESGSGKTTLANVILKLTNATSGNVRINGIDIAHDFCYVFLKGGGAQSAVEMFDSFRDGTGE